MGGTGGDSVRVTAPCALTSPQASSVPPPHGNQLTPSGSRSSSSGSRSNSSGSSSSSSRAGVVVTNWAATYSARPSSFYEPSSVEEVVALVGRAGREGRALRVVGGAHSPNACAMSDDAMVSLSRLSRVLSVDAGARVVVAEAGARLDALHPLLDSHGLAFPNLGSISEQTLAGMIATGTHGTGARSGCLATCITSLDIVVATGDGEAGAEVLTCTRTLRPDLFRAALCSLGVLGVIVRITFRAVPAFDLRAVETPTDLGDVLSRLPSAVASAPFFRFWWFPHTDRVVEWRAHPVAPRTQRAPPPGILARVANWLVDMGLGFHALQAALAFSLALPPLVPVINRAWFSLLFGRKKERVDRSDLVFNINCLFKQHVDEWALPVDELPGALEDIRSLLSAGGWRAHFPVEVRFVAGDDIWLSPSYGRPTVWIGVIAYKPYGIESPYKPYFRAFEEAMGRRGGRPHWAKDFHWRGAEPGHFAAAYPMWGRFLQMRAALDPRGTFLNPWARRALGLEEAGSGAGAYSKSASAELRMRIRAGLEAFPSAAVPGAEGGDAVITSAAAAGSCCEEDGGKPPSSSTELAVIVGKVRAGLGYSAAGAKTQGD